MKLLKLVIAFLALSFLLDSPAYAASPCTEELSTKNWGSVYRREPIVSKLTLSWTADTDGSFTDYETTKTLNGWIVGVETDPGSTAPTDDYDITIESANGVDLLGGSGADRDTANTEYTRPYINNTYAEVPYQGKLTLTITNNSVDSAVGDVIIYYYGEYR